MTLREKQCKFTRLLGKLLVWADSAGFEVALREAYRTPEQAALNAASGKGISKSLHTLGLAADLMLYIKGNYMTRSEDYAPLGDHWKSLDPDCAWGGDFVSKPDGNHFSLKHEGRR